MPVSVEENKMKPRSLATADRERVSYAYVFLGSLTDCAMQWTRENRRCCTTWLLSNRIDSIS